jgi:glycosyltransferase involved in cell wall biosynthesis
VIEALGRLAEPPELHVAGDGEERARYAALARGLPVVFHGRVPHERIPLFVQASDVCLAPYDPSAFPDGEVAYSTLKIPEAMACARAVATVPGTHTGSLVENGVSGFLVDNTVAAWTRLLEGLPARAELDRLGERGAARAAGITWERTAAGYLEVCRALAEKHPGRNAGRAPTRAR